jgi:hypothetical protein
MIRKLVLLLSVGMGSVWASQRGVSHPVSNHEQVAVRDHMVPLSGPSALDLALRDGGSKIDGTVADFVGEETALIGFGPGRELAAKADVEKAGLDVVEIVKPGNYIIGRWKGGDRYTAVRAGLDGLLHSSAIQDVSPNIQLTVGP